MKKPLGRRAAAQHPKKRATPFELTKSLRTAQDLCMAISVLWRCCEE